MERVDSLANNIDEHQPNNNDNYFNDNELRIEDPPSTHLWVFGYGSLCWQPGFQYKNAMNGYVRGYARKFWQGNTTHRGTDNKPGRVATLIEEPNSIVWGRAYEIEGDAALPYLDTRECRLGGYMTQLATFYPRQKAMKPFATLLYIATPSNQLWLGDAPLTDIAQQIFESSGNSGHNVEYLLRLAMFMRDSIPEAVDEHLFTLEYLVRTRAKQSNINIDTLMGTNSTNIPSSFINHHAPIGVAGAPQPPQQLVDSFRFTAHVPEKQLRCLKM